MKTILTRRPIAQLLSAVITLFTLNDIARAQSGTWTNPGGGSWAVAANWNGDTIASGAGNTADFSTLDLTGAPTVTLDGALTIGNLLFGDVGHTYGWTLNTGSAGPLTLAVASGSPTITVDGQTNTIGLVLAGTNGLTVNGPGTLALLGNNTYTGTTIISSSTVNVGDGSAAGSLGTGAVVDDGTLIYDLVGSSTSATLPGAGITGSGTLSATANTVTLTGNVTTSNTQTYNATADGSLYQGVYVNAPNIVLSTTGGAAINLTGDCGTEGANQNNLTVDTSSGNGTINLNCSFGRNYTWYGLNSFTANAGTGTINWSGSYGSAGSESTPINLIGALNVTGGFNCAVALTMTLDATAPGSVSGILSGPMSLVKTGPSSLALAGANTYTGTTTVSNGTVLVNGAIASGSVTVASGGALGGSGTIGGATTVQSGGTLGLAAGEGSGTEMLAIDNSLTLNSGSTSVVRISKTGGAPASDLFEVMSSTTLGGTLVVTNVTTDGTPLAAGDTFHLFSSTGFTGTFATLSLPVLPAGLGWNTTGLGANGTLSVVANVNVNPTDIMAAVSGGQLTLAWPFDHTGWRLLMQTNHLADGISTNSNDWMTVSGSTATNEIIVPIIATNPADFYRLVYP